MIIQELRKELVEVIDTIDNEELLRLLKEDLLFYGQLKAADITDSLSREQTDELKGLAAEEESFDTHTLAEFKKATDRWRIK